jgi:maltose O-acetyltransferase
MNGNCPPPGGPIVTESAPQPIERRGDVRPRCRRRPTVLDPRNPCCETAPQHEIQDPVSSSPAHSKVPRAAPGPNLGRRVKRRIGSALRWLVREAQYRVLYLWSRLMGPPRLLVYHKDINVRLLRAFGATVGENTILVAPITLSNIWQGYRNLTIEDAVTFNGGTFLDLADRITIGRGASLGPHVIVMTHNAFNKNAFLESRLPRLVGTKPVSIGAGAGIKAAAVILHGVTIGEEALVAGGSIVNRDVPRRAYVSGVPAVVRRDLDQE